MRFYNHIFPLEMEVQSELAKTFELFKEERCDSATIRKKNGVIDRIELNQKPSPDTKIHEILGQSENQDIIIKKREGRVIHMDQTKIKKI